MFTEIVTCTSDNKNSNKACLIKITASSKYATSVSDSQLHNEGNRLTIAAQNGQK